MSVVEAVEELGYEAPDAFPIRPLHALGSLKRIVRNKENTAMAFEVIGSLVGGATHRAFVRFAETDVGARILGERRELVDTLMDRTYLRSLPEGSLGRAYLAFMERENLSADGLKRQPDEGGATIDPDRYPELSLYARRVRDSHDLWHVLTGYGRDGLGELCLLAFSFDQTKSPGHAVLSVGGAISFSRKSKGVPALKAIHEAWRLSRQAEWLPGADIEALLPAPLEAVRARLNLSRPAVYDAVPAGLKSAFGAAETAPPPADALTA